jgi:predicted patatin/cPLA2 family phospholipase
MGAIRKSSKEALEEKIEAAKERVIRTKAAHEAAVDALQKLLDKQTAMRSEEIARAITNSSKSYEEILRFITEDDA